VLSSTVLCYAVLEATLWYMTSCALHKVRQWGSWLDGGIDEDTSHDPQVPWHQHAVCVGLAVCVLGVGMAHLPIADVAEQHLAVIAVDL